MYIEFIDWIENRQLDCFYKTTFGVECPGCGIQRASIALLRGELIESLILFPALIPIIAMLIFLVVHLVYKLNSGAKILLSLLVFNFVITIINYVLFRV